MGCGVSLNTGASDSSCTEKVADAFLWLPRVMWHPYNIKVVKTNDGHYFELEEDTVEKVIRSGFGCCCYSGVGFPCYALGFLAALPCMAVGMPLKNYALSTDLKAAEYSRLVEEFLYDNSELKEMESLVKG